MTAFLLVSFCHSALMASSAFLRLAAAKTTRSPPCARAGTCGVAQASNAAATTPAALPNHLRLEIMLPCSSVERTIADWPIQDHKGALSSSKYLDRLSADTSQS